MTSKEKDILRSLAGRVREISDLPEMEERRQRFYNLNALKPDRPVVLCSPEGAWGELLPSDRLECTDELLRGWEYALRSQIYSWEHIKDDIALEPCFGVGWCVNCGDYGVTSQKTHGENRGSYRWDPVIKDLDKDLDKLTFRAPSVDRKQTRENMDLANEILGDLLTVQPAGGFWWTMGLTWSAIDLIGLEGLMLAMYDNPEGLHRLMKWLMDEQMNFITWFEKEGLLTINNRNGGVGSGGVAYTHELPQPDWKEGQPARLKDLWGFGESQETVGVSPEMFAEFIFPYQLPLLNKFGLNCYGCCEAVHERWQYIRNVPNLRRISVAPWCDQRIMAKNLGKDYVYSRKPNPALICVSFDEDAIRKDIRNTLEAAGNCALEFIMKDTHTVQNDPSRITRWVEIALEEVKNYAEAAV
jgi:hypothetical protein